MGKLDGRCLCGTIAYSCDAEPVATAICHCTECQRQTGTSFSILVAVPRKALQLDWDSLGSVETMGTDTGLPTTRTFCRDCGSPLASYGEALPQLAFIKAGTLDDRSWLEPEVHIWCDSAQPWEPLASLPGEKQPRAYQGR